MSRTCPHTVAGSLRSSLVERCRRLRLGAYYTFIRFHPTIARPCSTDWGSSAFGIIGGYAGIQVVTVHTGRQFPLIDQTLAAADRFSYFDWLTVG